MAYAGPVSTTYTTSWFTANPATVPLRNYIWPNLPRHDRLWPSGPPPETHAQHDFEREMAEEVLEDVHDGHVVLSQAVGRTLQPDKGGKGVGEARLASARHIEHVRRRLQRVKRVEAVGPCVPRWGRGEVWEVRRGERSVGQEERWRVWGVAWRREELEKKRAEREQEMEDRRRVSATKTIKEVYLEKMSGRVANHA